LKQKGTEKIQGKNEWLPLMAGQVPPALPANAQQSVITGNYFSFYFCRLFKDIFYNKVFSKSWFLLRVV
jgi:hypothetical protein